MPLASITAHWLDGWGEGGNTGVLDQQRRRPKPAPVRRGDYIALQLRALDIRRVIIEQFIELLLRVGVERSTIVSPELHAALLAQARAEDDDIVMMIAAWMLGS